MKYSDVYKVVFMENVKTSSCVWTQFIKSKGGFSDIEKYVSNSDCMILYVARLDEVESMYTEKPIDELVNGKMIYHSTI